MFTSGNKSPFQTISGRLAGSFGWGGMPNIYYFVDPTTGVGSILGAQLTPFFDPKMVELRDEIEGIICRTLTDLHPGYSLCVTKFHEEN